MPFCVSIAQNKYQIWFYRTDLLRFAFVIPNIATAPSYIWFVFVLLLFTTMFFCLFFIFIFLFKKYYVFVFRDKCVIEWRLFSIMPLIWSYWTYKKNHDIKCFYSLKTVKSKFILRKMNWFDSSINFIESSN